LKLRYTRPALADLKAILAYVALESPQGADRVRARIRSLLDLLRAHPFIGSPTDDPDIRRLVITPFPCLVFYQVTNNEVIIHAVRHSAQNPADMPGSA
jgi:addiction module RelE/StbE family toxin